MYVDQAVLTRRSVRRYLQKPVPPAFLTRLVELGRLYASGGNLQPVRFALIAGPDLRRQIFDQIHWAMYLPEFEVSSAEQPGAYILLLRDGSISKSCDFDIGAAATTIMLSARQYGLDSCCLASFSAANLQKLLQLEESLVPEMLIALGYGAQTNQTEPYDNTQRYRLDAQGNFIVPKYTAKEVLLFSDIE